MNTEYAALNWATLRGFVEAKRALEVAMSGNHSILLVGSPGSGKALLARSLRTILPDVLFVDPSPDMAFSVVINQVISARGMLFLENMERWDERPLILLRETMGKCPGQFLLVATSGYCPCGNFGDAIRECVCRLGDIECYQRRLRELVFACFALEYHVQSVNPERRGRDEASLEVTKRVNATRVWQRQRQRNRFSSELSLAELQADDALFLDEPAQRLLSQIVAHLPLSPEQYVYLHQVATTSASMAIANPIWEEPVTQVQSNHLAEATCLRPANYWHGADRSA